MAVVLRSFLAVRQFICPNCCYNQRVIRRIYSPTVLELDKFSDEQEVLRKRVGNYKERFLKEVEKCANDGKPVFTDDLKTLILLADTTQQYNLTLTVLDRYREHQRKDAFPSFFKQGEYILRMLYTSGEVDTAFKWFLDESCNVDERSRSESCYLLMMDMLWKGGRYDDVLTLLTNYTDQGSRHPSFSIATVGLATLYKMNTKASLHQTQSMLSDLCIQELSLSTRCLFYACMLAYKQQEYGLILEFLNLPVFYNTTIGPYAKSQNMRILAYAGLGRLEEALLCLKSLLVNLDTSRPVLFPDVLNAVSVAVMKSGDPELQTDFDYINKSVHRAGFVREETSDEYVCRNIGPGEDFFNLRLNTNENKSGIRRFREWPSIRSDLSHKDY